MIEGVMELPSWFMYIFDVAIGLAVILIWMFIMRHKYSKATKGHMVAEIWRANGFRDRQLVPLAHNGKAIELNNTTYLLEREVTSQEMEQIQRDRKKYRVTDKKQPIYPSVKFCKYPDAPPLNLKWLQVEARIESWYENNPEPIRPFYGMIDPETEKFVAGRLMVTAAEVYAMNRESQAIAAGEMATELENTQKVLMDTIKNQIKPMYIYIGLILAIASSVVMGIYLSSQLSSLLHAWGL